MTFLAPHSKLTSQRRILGMLDFSCVLPVLSHIWLFATSQTVARQAPLSMEFSRQEYWSGLPFPSPGDLPGSETEPTSLVSPALAGGFFTTAHSLPPRVSQWVHNKCLINMTDKTQKTDFPGSPVVKTSYLQCRACGSDPRSGN